MSISIRIANWNEQQAIAQAIRYEVFVVEQNIPVELEWDEMDAVCLHAIAFDEQGQGMATGRLLPDGHIGRMAVHKKARSSGIGGAILEALIEAAHERGDRIVKLNAQAQVENFYKRHGFVRDGDVFMEAGIEHIAMSRILEPV